MTVPEFLAALADAGARLSVREGRLRFHGPRALFDEGLRAMLRAHEAALVEFLSRRVFTADELDALGFLGEPDGDGSFSVTILCLKGPRPLRGGVLLPMFWAAVCLLGMAEPQDRGQVEIHYIKSPLWRTVLADGVYGGLTPSRGVHLAFFSERGAIPQREMYETAADGKLGKKIDTGTVGKTGIARELEVDIRMDLGTAKAVRTWLDTKIAALEKLPGA